MSWSFHFVSRALSALVATVATLVVAFGTPNIVQVEDDRLVAEQHREHIDHELSDAPGVAAYTVSQLRQGASSSAVIGTHVVVSLTTNYSPAQLGQLLTKLFSDGCNVALVRFEFTPTSSLEVVHAERDAQQWAELVDSVDQLENTRMRLAQFGPDSIAQFRLEVSSRSQNVIDAYEQLHRQALPDWVAIGQLQFETTDGVWPRLTVDTERAVTAAEWQQFLNRVEKLREATHSQMHFSLSMTATDSDDTAKFEESIVPAQPPQFTPGPDPLQP